MRLPLGLLGIPIDRVTLSEAVAYLLTLIERADKAHYVATVNVDFFTHLYHPFKKEVRSSKLQQTIRSASLVTADGAPLVWMSQLLGYPLPERVSGASLVPALASACAEKGYSFFLLGGERAVTEQAAEKLQIAYPGLRIAGLATPRISLDPEDAEEQSICDGALLKEIQASAPQVLLIGLGCPKQELWFQRVQSTLKVPLSIGVGGTFKFIAGNTRRAPLWMQHAGLEWCYRWWEEPRLLTQRYLRDLGQFPLLALRFLFLHGRRREENPLPKMKREGSNIVVARDLKGCGEREEVMHFLGDDSFTLDFSETETLDCGGAGLLLELMRQTEASRLTAVGLKADLKKQLDKHRLDNLFEN